MITDQAQGR